MRWFWLALLPWVTGCEALRLSELLKQFPPLSHSVTEPPGERCPLGGQVVSVGTDTNGNEVLDEDEVTSTEVHCLDPGELLVTVEPVPFGTRCLGGGQVTRAGRDVNGNGLLDAEEVDREVYSCWPVTDAPILTRVRAAGTPLPSCPEPATLTLVDAGPDENGDKNLDDDEVRTTLTLCAPEPLLLVELDWEPAGARCAVGGTRVLAGVDQNADTQLDASEVLASSALCRDRQTFEGDFLVQDDTDLAVLQGIGRIRGTLQFRGGGPSMAQMRLPSLEVVDGAVVIEGNPSLTRLELPGLRFIGQGLVIRGNDALETLKVGGANDEKLWVSTDLTVEDNARLTSLDGLRTVVPRGGVRLIQNAVLTQRPYQGLDAIQFLDGTVDIRGNGALEMLPLPNLVSVGGDVLIEDNASLLSLSGTALTFIGGQLMVKGNASLLSLQGLFSLQVISTVLVVRENERMISSVGLDNLWQVGGGIYFYRNDAMTYLGGMPFLKSMDGEFHVDSHARLATVGNMPALVNSGYLTFSRNPKLTALHGLSKLEQLKGLTVRDCDALLGLEDLSSLSTVGSMFVEDNANLTRLELGKVRQVTDYLALRRNPRLPTCQAQAFATRFYTGPSHLLFVAGNDDQATCP
ncbi:DUF7151 family protein [Corallococcus terminator]